MCIRDRDSSSYNYDAYREINCSLLPIHYSSSSYVLLFTKQYFTICKYQICKKQCNYVIVLVFQSDHLNSIYRNAENGVSGMHPLVSISSRISISVHILFDNSYIIFRTDECSRKYRFHFPCYMMISLHLTCKLHTKWYNCSIQIIEQ